MKIAVTSTGGNLDSQIDPRFGRCQYFIIVNPETMEFEVVQNPNIQAGGGAGIATAQMIAQKGVNTVITGNVGPNAFQTLSAAGIKIIVGASGTVRDVIEKYKKGELKSTIGPSVGAHFGMGGGMGMGRGMGGGRGMGRGMGMGFFQTPYGPGQMGPTAPQMSREQELAMLKRQAQTIEKQLEQIKTKIKELEEK